MLRGIIAPHAGLQYSGATAGYAYAALEASGLRGAGLIKRVILLAPSHAPLEPRDGSGARFVFGLSPFHVYDSPFGPVRVDHRVYRRLRRAEQRVFQSDAAAAGGSMFGYVSHDHDRSEHAVELQLPFLNRILFQKIKSKKEEEREEDAQMFKSSKPSAKAKSEHDKALSAGADSNAFVGDSKSKTKGFKAKQFKRQFWFVPIVIGDASEQQLNALGQLLAPLFDDSEVYTTTPLHTTHTATAHSTAQLRLLTRYHSPPPPLPSCPVLSCSVRLCLLCRLT
jgi:predicted class III extradiol MEMO1 family dioxygenase